MPPQLSSTDLNRLHAIPGIAEILENESGPHVGITTKSCTATMHLHGAQITSWKPATSQEIIFQSSKARWEEGQAIRGGIPICFPWFRAKANDPQAPAHGFARTKAWQIESIVENETGVVVTVFTGSDETTQRWWPGDFRLVHRATFGSGLRLELVCTNTGTTPLRFEEALHTYSRVADIQSVRLQG